MGTTTDELGNWNPSDKSICKTQPTHTHLERSGVAPLGNRSNFIRSLPLTVVCVGQNGVAVRSKTEKADMIFSQGNEKISKNIPFFARSSKLTWTSRSDSG